MRSKWKIQYPGKIISLLWNNTFPCIRIKSVSFNIFLFFILHGNLKSQSNVWPEFLMIPEENQEETEAGQNSLILTNRFLFCQTLKEENSVVWHVDHDRYYFDQQSNYALTMYNRSMSDNSFSLPGAFYKKGFPWTSSNLGIEWIPKMNYKIRTGGKTYQSTVDFGPAFSNELYRVPVKIRTGISADVWKENIKGQFLKSMIKGYSSDAGYYIGCEIGDEGHLVKDIPLYFSFKATGRSVRGAGLGLMMGKAIYAYDPGTGDTLLFSIYDSLSNGKESFLSNGAQFQTSPWRIVHGMTTGGGIKMAERFGFCPAGYYRYTYHSANYPSDSSEVNDVKGSGHHINLQLSSLSRFFFDYSGGIQCSWSNEDWVYKSGALSSKISSDGSDRRKIMANINDNLIFRARMDHNIIVPLPAKFTFEYSYYISRESRMYNNYYLTNRTDTMRNIMENDGVGRSHHFGITRNDSAAISCGFFYDYGKSILHYLRKERSGKSTIRDNHRIGTFIEIERGRLALKEEISVQAEKSDYLFKDAHRGPGPSFDPPTQQRNFNSTLSGSWIFNDYFTLVGKWLENYGDDGRWYGKEYLPDTATSADYYAIQKKTNDYTLAMHLKISYKQIDALIGGSFRDIYSLQYNISEKKYITSNIDDGYTYEPYIQFVYRNNSVTSMAKVKREFKTADPHRWSLYKNWDISMYIQKEW